MQLVQITPEKKVRLTNKQSEILRNLDNFGSLYVSFKDPDMRTFEALVKRGLATSGPDPAGMGLGKTYKIVKVQA